MTQLFSIPADQLGAGGLFVGGQWFPYVTDPTYGLVLALPAGGSYGSVQALGFRPVGTGTAAGVGGGGYVEYNPPTGNPDNVPVIFARVDNVRASTVVYTRTFTTGVFHFNVGINAVGQVVYVGPWGAGAAGGVEYPTGSGTLY